VTTPENCRQRPDLHREFRDFEHFCHTQFDMTNSPVPDGVSQDDSHSAAEGTILSPSLLPWKRGDAAAYELKFLLSESQARDVEQMLAGSLGRDPHADPDLDHAYRITTVYCDTPAYDVFHRRGNHRRRKYRIRSYGPGTRVSLERKTKVGQQVRKKRVIVPPEELFTLSHPQVPGDWEGEWFHRQIQSRRLSPVCCVSYLRTAFVGDSAEGPVRLTFDRDLAGYATQEWLPRFSPAAIGFLADKVVCEFKFRGSLPNLFKQAIQELHLDEAGNSKYRNCLISSAVQAEQDPSDA
jgi:VTC domain